MTGLNKGFGLVIATALVAVMAIFATGCTDYEREVGGSCYYHSDCEDRCVSGRHFPGGMCTITCDGDYDCPSGTYCIDRSGGICMLGCERHHDCRRDYECSRESRHGSSGRTDVCIGD